VQRNSEEKRDYDPPISADYWWPRKQLSHIIAYQILFFSNIKETANNWESYVLDLLITLDRGFNWFNPFHTLANIIDLYHDIIMSLSPVYDVHVICY